MSTVKPCPFCGAMPESDVLRSMKKMISCENEECEAQPYVVGKTMEEAIEFWDRRATE